MDLRVSGLKKGSDHYVFNIVQKRKKNKKKISILFFKIVFQVIYTKNSKREDYAS